MWDEKIYNGMKKHLVVEMLFVCLHRKIYLCPYFSDTAQDHE